MGTKYKILITLLLLSYTTLSQIDTNRICFPYHIVQNISIELLQKDSLEFELVETQYLVTTLVEKSKTQDSLISNLEKQEENYISQIDNLSQQDTLHTQEISRLYKTNKRLKLVSKILGGGFIGTLLILIIFI